MGLEAGLGEALRADYFMLREEFTPAQLDCLQRTRGFVHEEVPPVINGYWERAGRDITSVSAFTAGA
ncbi:MAG: hypothetical protein WA794_04635 [Trebonia sp.]